MTLPCRYHRFFVLVVGEPDNVSCIALQVVVGSQAFLVHHTELASREHEMASLDLQIEAGQILSSLQALLLISSVSIQA